MEATAPDIGVIEGRCAHHVDRAAAGICERCGSFYCSNCFERLAGRAICSACLATPGVDYRAVIRAETWGRRDGWVWCLGLYTLLASLFIALAMVFGQQWLFFCVSLVVLIV